MSSNTHQLDGSTRRVAENGDGALPLRAAEPDFKSRLAVPSADGETPHQPGIVFRRLPVPAVLAAALALLAVIAWGDYQVKSLPNVAILCIIPVVIAASSGNTKALWFVAVAAIVVTLSALLLPPPVAIPRTGIQVYGRQINRVLLVVNLLFISCTLHALVATHRWLLRSRDEHRQRGEELAAQNIQLAEREEEIGQQNEELQSQAEEMERQSEELRVSNGELQGRQKLLTALLTLSRELPVITSRHDAMDRICHAVAQLMNDARAHSAGEDSHGQVGIAAAFLERRGESEIHVVAHAGFEGGLQQDCWPFEKSFASLVLSRDRTGFLHDVTLRPDLAIPQSSKNLQYRSVLAVPVRLSGKSACSLEIYRTDTHVCTDGQNLMLQSLAAQTATSLAALDLFERVDMEQRRLRQILATLPIGVGTVDAAATEVRLNPAGGTLLGLPSETPLTPQQMHGSWQKFRDGQPVSVEDMAILQAVRLNRQIDSAEREFLFPDGRRVTVMMTAAPIHDAVGTVVGGVCAFVDITRLKELQHQLDARGREAEESSRRKSRFLAAVSHDIRTPANAISLLAELMQRTASTPSLAGEIPEIAADLKRSALTLVDLVSDVLDLTRFDSGRVEFQEAVLPLRELLVEDCRQFIAAAREKGLEFICEAPAEDIKLCADRVKVARILGNLISNAIKYTPAGRVTVTSRREPDGEVSIIVSDTGTGIPQEHLEDIFDEFFQLKSAAGSDRTRGSGLGLAICRRLADAMGGKISAQSTLGSGSTFILTLPASCVLPG